MRGWSMVASAIGAVGAGAGLAALTRHRERGRAPEPAAISPATVPLAAPDEPADDPQAALDAARERLRQRADDLRTRIESAGDEA